VWPTIGKSDLDENRIPQYRQYTLTYSQYQWASGPLISPNPEKENAKYHTQQLLCKKFDKKRPKT